MDKQFFEQEVETAIQSLKKGGVILYPTDTIWGLGCDATDAAAIQRIFGIKQRADGKSMIILLADERDVLQYVASPDLSVFDFLAQQERPTTVIFDGAVGLPGNLVAEDGSIAIRLVRDEFCRHLVKRLRKPLVSTSANISGQPSPTGFQTVSQEVKDLVDHIVQWRKDDDTPALPSQIIRWKEGEPVYIRR
ncbi:MAG TPA: L-threonylcarbamoyladenylate synthase [Flavisolibacter sp.]|nr:L-threonylcarbamoyladenylate synthase [Flavisolibacter sp.]